MILRRFRFLHSNLKGFTLVELLVAIAIAGLITAGISVAIMQVLTINTRASNHMIAVRQVQQAGKEVSKDALQAQPSKIDDGPSGAFLVLNWTDWEGANNTVVYTLETMPSSPALMMLQRSQSINGTDQTPFPLTVAEYIDDSIDPVTLKPKTRCEWDEIRGVLTFTVTATVGGESETRTYEIEPRPDS
jgi:prepilin-type N-terminal cleavage/methylation domain-containing protein